MSGIAALCPEFRKLHDGVEGADSYTVNAHKWMLTNFDCNLFWVRSRAALTGALGLLPEYLNNRASASGEVIDYRDWQIPLGRRFRALKLWFVLRRFGDDVPMLDPVKDLKLTDDAFGELLAQAKALRARVAAHAVHGALTLLLSFGYDGTRASSSCFGAAAKHTSRRSMYLCIALARI